jgi:ABC-2 type transport system permease protein
MSVPANAVAAPASRAQERAAIPWGRAMLWALRRELWESWWLTLAPLAVAALYGIGFFFHALGLPAVMRATAGLDAIAQRNAIAMPYDLAAGLMMATAMLVGGLYCVDALYGERRDRSVLFWKSLPVSDFTAVLAKAVIAILFLPLYAFAVAVVLQACMLFLSSGVLVVTGHDPALLWARLSFVQMSLLLLYHMVMVHALWYAPLYAWLILVSAWAPRAPIAWAVLPPLAVVYLEKIVFNTTRFVDMLSHRLGGGMDSMTMPGTFPMNTITTRLTPVRYFTSSGFWIGIAITIAFLWLAARLRRRRGPI